MKIVILCCQIFVKLEKFINKSCNFVFVSKNQRRVLNEIEKNGLSKTPLKFNEKTCRSYKKKLTIPRTFFIKL